ncbi:GNAT family N-acetyltransferase [Deinococcus sp. HMF7604]|uniref:GNAT family N-acetyltransferase n=1 Tax=Deinococcus betulae TaxID=2873312 RepID=UPI001CCDC203|nr:GNAT family N-acetyltransferase [Deinococcus betulae]MBZ9752429.1 GNAT family N-acetyltransferase [Deinococcus betulae]
MLRPILSLPVTALLTRAMFPNPVRVQAELEAYRTDPARQVWVWEAQGQPASAAGLRIEGRHATLLHIATAPGQERQGYGGALLRAVTGHLDLLTLSAETDDSAADFYRRCGLTVQEVPSPWVGRRYRCEWRATPS